MTVVATKSVVTPTMQNNSLPKSGRQGQITNRRMRFARHQATLGPWQTETHGASLPSLRSAIRACLGRRWLGATPLGGPWHPSPSHIQRKGNQVSQGHRRSQVQAWCLVVPALRNWILGFLHWVDELDALQPLLERSRSDDQGRADMRCALGATEVRPKAWKNGFTQFSRIRRRSHQERLHWNGLENRRAAF